ncbi:D-alanyl-D-alanine carboxypeptidase/D-alanyl-D-alanine endopeptidase [Nocardia aurea]|uniref:D-alanyl-D-alanine carboxypeptidase/D-alanyl-D-alanine endopeptidase n=1 Tax=Nocardia aurea TaxID=2144174 RepID=UPI00130052D6|nr:D-alanyl-D-alanine carboxypeptidase/D-alanyl-D-alanine-endopeptidase [Nocardia aurea]
MDPPRSWRSRLRAFLPATAAPPAAPAGELARDLDRILGDPRLSMARIGVVVKSAVTGEPLYERDPDQIFTPASFVKLLTSAAALDTLGPGHRFTTRVLASGRLADGTLHGDLHLQGTGDPALLPGDLDRLAGEVAAAGIHSVTGRLVPDDTWFDDVRVHADWAVGDEPRHYAAPISALAAAPDADCNTGALVVTVAPGAAPGAPAEVTTTPPTGHVAIDNRATTGLANDVWITRPRDTNEVVVTGAVAAPLSWRVSVPDVTGYAAALLRDALASHGVAVDGETRRAAPPTTAWTVARHESMPLARLMTPFLKWSNNMHAEILVKAMGREVSGQGTWAAGLRVLTEYAERHGLRTACFRDGSGMSRLASLTPGELTDFLLLARAKPWFASWYDALPVAGQGDRMTRGTLRDRMKGTPAAGNVHAKTAALTGVSGLAGYVDSADGEPLAFCVIFNHFLDAPVKDVEEVIAVRLARFSRLADHSGREPNGHLDQ